MWLICDPEQLIRSLGFATQMSFFSPAKNHNLVKSDRLRMFESKDAKPIELARQQTCARAHSGSWNNEHQYTLAGHPAITVLQEHQFRPFITVRPKLTVIGWIQVQERTAFRQHPALKRAAMDRRDSFPCGCRGPVRVEFDASQ